jgi:L-asparagine transporter-like permease
MSDSPVISRRLQLLFLAALLGVLLVLGIGVGALAGPWALLAYSVVVVALLAVGAARARAAQERARGALLRPGGQSCACCTTSQHDPVKVVG